MNISLNLKKLISNFKIPLVVRLEPELLKAYRYGEQKKFIKFFRYACVAGLFIYIIMIVWDFISRYLGVLGREDLQLLPREAIDFVFDDTLYRNILKARITLVAAFITGLGCSFIPRFYKIAQYFGMLFIMGLIANVAWVQRMIESGLNEGYGMLITPGADMSIIVLSGAEIGYGAFLAPLLLLPIGFTAFQSLLIFITIFLGVNYGMTQADLPSAFIETTNTVLVIVSIVSTMLAYLVNQGRRAAFKLEYELGIAKEEAEEASEAKSKFLATMSHEVRTPLSGILGIAGLVMDTGLNQKQLHYVENIKYSGETLLAMLNDILDFSKMEAGKFDIEKLDIDFNKLLTSVIDLMRSRADEQGVDIKLELGDNVPKYVHSDPTRMRQVLLNLLSNAIKFTEEGHVMIKVTSTSKNADMHQMKFEIIDTGIGIPEEARRNLFREFAQADSSTSRKYGGTGLGLSICKKIVELLDGEIAVDSEVGKGSNFWFEIPMQEIDGSSLQKTEEKEKLPQLNPLHILLADDNAINQKIAHDLLKKGGHSIEVVDNGLRALEAVKADDTFDVILMDMQMPEMDGLESTREIKKLGGKAGDIPIIALTANDMKGDAARCKAVGMIDHIAKPFDPKKLTHVLAEYIPHMIEGQEDKVAKGKSQTISVEEMEVDSDALLKLEKSFNKSYVVEFIEKYLPSISKEIADLETAIANDDEQRVIELCESLKDESLMCGLLSVNSIVEAVEASFKEAQKDEGTAILQTLPATYKANLEALHKHYPIKF